MRPPKRQKEVVIMANTKMTQVSALELAVEVITNVMNGVETDMAYSELSEAVTKLCGMAEKLAEKRSTPSKADKEKSAEHKAIADEIILVLSTEETVTNGMTVSEMQKASEMLAGYSNQKISAILRKMVDSGAVVKTTDKKKSYFSVATDE